MWFLFPFHVVTMYTLDMFKVSNTLKNFLGLAILLGYLTILFYTPIHMIEMANMNMPMEHCPFALSKHVICTSTISEHMRVWQNWLQNLLSSFKMIAVTVLFFTGSCFLIPSLRILRLLLYCKQQDKVKVFSLVQHLFSQGILHTKAY
jgi:hypothetical protein